MGDANYRRRAFRTRIEHQLIIVQACEQEPALLHANPADRASKQLYVEKWKELTKNLNSLGYGEKSTDKWQRAVTDWVSKIKTKYLKIKEFISTTGLSRPASGLNLSDLEIRILTLKGYNCKILDGQDDKIENNPTTSKCLRIKEELNSNDSDTSNNINNLRYDINSEITIEPIRKKAKVIVEEEDEGEEFCSMEEETLKTLKIISDNLERLTNAVEIVANKLIK